MWPYCNATPLMVARKPDNPYGAKAMRIDWKGLKLNYVPRIENHAVSQMLDRSERLAARIIELHESENPCKRVKVRIEVVV